VSGWERYRLDVLDDVLRELGALSDPDPPSPEMRAWATKIGSHLHIFSYEVVPGAHGVAAD